MDFKWSVQKMQVAENNLVVKVDLIVIGIDGDNSASAAYTRELVRGDTVVPYEQLTEQQVLEWCFAPETTETAVRYIKTEGEAQVAGQIARRLAQKALEPDLPWVAKAE
jgi:hypothetical protein